MALTVLEIAVVEIIVPWTALRMILLVLGVYGLLIMAGFVAANRTRPHILTSDSLLLRCGLLADVAVPINQVTSVSVGLRRAGYGPIIVGDTLTLGVAGSVHVALNLSAPFPIRAGKVVGEVRTILFAADESAVAARLIRSQLPDA
ncbi:hypothetical protein EH165_00570 [Nakamurella antarctica]|uniref:PH domain-containing protein n=1 Tax=Nakamurella antarctica TaxID=1902245 RepID=A0A3G8ZJ70_9ACTN|nr:hypothetical protein [Nakamurella antarctica]AZI56885.1 hypothetical protein EH165_00570 [Nakamurella antarctica]